MTEQEKRYRRLYRLAREMVSVIGTVAESRTVRTDCSLWERYFARRLKPFKTWNTQ